MQADMGLPDDVLDEVPFGRNRFLRLAGSALFGAVAAATLRTAPAEANHLPTPYPCVGFPACDYCNGRICYQYCRAPYRQTCWANGQPNSDQCWNTCGSNHKLYRCCDWVDTRGDDEGCICSELWGNCT